MAERFPLQSAWGSAQDQEAWRDQLERTGLENVRIRLMQHIAGSGGSIAIGNQTGITKGFIEEWVTWNENKKAEADEAYRAKISWWTKIAAFGAVAAAIATAVQAFFGYLSLK